MSIKSISIIVIFSILLILVVGILLIDYASLVEKKSIDYDKLMTESITEMYEKMAEDYTIQATMYAKENNSTEEIPQLKWVTKESEPIITDAITFNFNEQQIVIGKKELISMSVEELHNLATLIELCRFWIDSDVMKILGEKLLPRFFIEDYQK